MINEILETIIATGIFEKFISSILNILRLQDDIEVNKNEVTLTEDEPGLISSSDSYTEIVEILSDYESSPTFTEYSTNSEKSLGDQFLDAVRNGEIETVSEFLEAGINPNFVDELGYTAALEAVRTENIDMLELLLQYGIDLTVKTPGGSTVMTYAKQNDNFVILALLRKYGIHSLNTACHTSNNQIDYYYQGAESETKVGQECVKSACYK